MAIEEILDTKTINVKDLPPLPPKKEEVSPLRNYFPKFLEASLDFYNDRSHPQSDDGIELEVASALQFAFQRGEYFSGEIPDYIKKLGDGSLDMATAMLSYMSSYKWFRLIKPSQVEPLKEKHPATRTEDIIGMHFRDPDSAYLGYEYLTSLLIWAPQEVDDIKQFAQKNRILENAQEYISNDLKRFKDFRFRRRAMYHATLAKLLEPNLRIDRLFNEQTLQQMLTYCKDELLSQKWEFASGQSAAEVLAQLRIVSAEKVTVTDKGVEVQFEPSQPAPQVAPLPEMRRF